LHLSFISYPTSSDLIHLHVYVPNSTSSVPQLIDCGSSCTVLTFVYTCPTKYSLSCLILISFLSSSTSRSWNPPPTEHIPAVLHHNLSPETISVYERREFLLNCQITPIRHLVLHASNTVATRASKVKFEAGSNFTPIHQLEDILLPLCTKQLPIRQRHLGM
jgi:hypothetical protein